MRLKSITKSFFQKICNHLVGTAYRLGIQVQYEDLDPVEYKKFLIERDARVESQLEYWRDQRTKKLLKTETTEAAATPATT
jgi:ribosomal protein S10